MKLSTKMLSKFTEDRDDYRLVGAWQTRIGHGEEIVHLWQYKNGYQSMDDETGDDFYPDDKVSSKKREVNLMFCSYKTQM